MSPGSLCVTRLESLRRYSWISCTGFTHPVQDLYLEDVLRIVGGPGAPVQNGKQQSGRPAANGTSSNKQQVPRASGET